MTTWPTNYNSHSSHPFVGLNWYASTSVRIRTLIFRGPDTNRLGCVAEKSQSAPVLVSFVSVASQWGCSCMQYSADRLRAPQGSTDRNCKQFQIRNYLNENKPKDRTEMSAASTGSVCTSPISPALPGQPKPNSISLTSLASILGRVAAGLLATMSRRPKPSASFSVKSCVDTASASKRRAF